MEILRMDYRFTALLIVMMTLLALFGGPAHSRNEYLNDGTNSCRTGEVDVRLEKENRENDYRHYNNDNNYDNDSDNGRISITYRHFIGTACTKEFRKVQQENMELKQQLELMKMCGRVNSNPSLAYNENFNLLINKCKGITPARDNTRPENDKSHWDELKDNYKKENPDITLMGDKFITNKKKLVIPKYLTEDTDKEIILPVPKD
jgi:hypothetical protein